MEVAEPGRSRHLRRDVPRLEAVDLVQRDHDGHAETEHAPSDEAVAGPDPLPRRTPTQQPERVGEKRGGRPARVLPVGPREDNPVEVKLKAPRAATAAG